MNEDFTRAKKARINIFVSLAGQLITLICGMIVPRVLIGSFGSEAYGATTSIVQFLAYISLLEGGIGGVARAALYQPLAEKSNFEISSVISEIRAFFRKVAIAFVAYALILATAFKFISGIEIYDWITTFMLVIVISISTFAEYYIGISNSILLQASQKTYVVKIVSSIGTVFNCVFSVLLTRVGCSLLTVKLVSSCVYAIKPFLLNYYVRKNYSIEYVTSGKGELKDKWSGLGQHMAFFLHSHTDIAVLTVFANLKLVAVYSVYNMIVGAVQSIITSFSTGMEALFGDMYAKKEEKLLQKTFSIYETILSIVALVLFSVAVTMITPFMRIYTRGITDIDYIHPTFGVLLVISAVLYVLRIPYHSMIVAAGHFRQTRLAAYGEAIINIAFSIVLVARFQLIGVAIGTVAAVLFRFVYYAAYLSRYIMKRRIQLFVKRMAVNSSVFLIDFQIGRYLTASFMTTNYAEWTFLSVMAALLFSAITFCVNILFYREECQAIVLKIRGR